MIVVAVVAVVIVAALVLQPLLLRPGSARRGLHHAHRVAVRTVRRTRYWFRRWLGALIRLLGAVLEAVLFYMVVTPTGLACRLLGFSVLPDGEWRTRRTAPRPAQAFVARGQGARTVVRGFSWRWAVVFFVVGALLATAVPAVLDRDGTDDAVPEGLRGATFNAFESPALADAEWAAAASAEFGAVGGGLTYTSYVGNSLRDFAGEYVNISGRERRSYQPSTDLGEPLDVWFFGGSTMFGFSAQRDVHTIPSEVVRLAEADGIAVRAHNFGSPGYVNFQETILFAQLLVAGRSPDLVVFYDGINDLAVQFQQAFGGIGTPGDLSDITAYAYRRHLAGQLTGTGEPPTPVPAVPDVGRPPQVDRVIEALMQTYEQGIDVATTLADRYDVPVLHFWQPDLYNKDELVEGEIELVERLGMDDFRYQAVADIAQAALAELPPGVIDLSDAYAGEPSPVLTDQAHTNELGARLVAEAMYPHLQSELGSVG